MSAGVPQAEDFREGGSSPHSANCLASETTIRIQQITTAQTTSCLLSGPH